MTAPQQPAPGHDGPPAADASGTIPTQTGQTAPAGQPAGSGLPDDTQPGWWALLACGHRVQLDPHADDPSPDPSPASFPCPRCEVRRPVDIYPLTALSDPDNVGWIPEDGTR